MKFGSCDVISDLRWSRLFQKEFACPFIRRDGCSQREYCCEAYETDIDHDGGKGEIKVIQGHFHSYGR
jgi:hypothetical protein